MRKPLLLPAALAAMAAAVPGAADATSTTCTTSTVCAEYINTYTYSSGMTTGGVAIHGEANSGIGVRGTSVTNVGFYGYSGSTKAVAPGVEGESTNFGKGAGGAFGLGNPADGVDAYGVYHGVFGAELSTNTSAASSGFGVFGADYALDASGDYNVGVVGQSIYGTALFAQASKYGPSAGFYGLQPVGVYSAVHTRSGTPSPDAYAFVGESNSVGFELQNTSENATMFGESPLFFLNGSGPTNNEYYYINYNGTQALSGTLTSSKGTYVRATGTSGGAFREYTARATMPSVEDFGEAQLMNGRAFVPIDARFGGTIDRRTSYLVFVTAEGDCNGLFVAQKTAAGFTVRERRGGRSSLAFQYRVVAKPVDENGARLEAMPEDPLAKAVALDRGRKPEYVSPPQTPIERMKEDLGPQRFADAMKALRDRSDSVR